MERLTEWDCDNQWYKPKKGVSHNAIHTKLGEYQETGLEPEEINKLKADYDRLNDFEQSQILALMQKNSKLETETRDLKALVAPRLRY